mgnify:CR=1 FL=1
MKKAVSILLILILIFTLLISSAFAETPSYKYYSDVSSNDSCYDAVNYLYEHKVFNGYTLPTGTTLGTFVPENSITRGQIAVLLWRMLNCPQPSGTLMDFNDCDENAYYYEAIRWASSSNVGIINGYGDGSFAPNVSITHQAACILLYRFACHCGYASNSAAAQQNYINIFNSSSLTNKSSFAENIKASAGWAYSYGIIDNNVVPAAFVSRGTAAEYIYSLYTTFQNKYGLAVVNTHNMSYVAPCGEGMKNLFVHYGATGAISKQDITKATFHNEMANAFSNAKALDICYLYVASHGSTSGLALFTDTYLSPDFLRTEIDRFNGTFVVLISGCHTGTYISEDSDGNSDVFDANLFVSGIYDDSLNLNYSEDLRDSKRIKVICSSRKDELSYSTNRLATNYWCLGAGYNYITNEFVSLYADSNSDGRISLSELCSYSYEQVNAQLSDYGYIQTVICYPQNDSFIIFENHY